MKVLPRRLTAFFLAVIMILPQMTAGLIYAEEAVETDLVSAEENVTEDESVSEEAAYDSDEDTTDESLCGNAVSWSLDEDTGVLTISGTGEMYDYYYPGRSSSTAKSPWYSSRASITSVVIEEGVTVIGNGAFYYCNALTDVTIPSSVTTISSGAFSCCTALESIEIPDTVTSVENDCFLSCTSLVSVTLPSGLTSIPYNTFMDCENLTDIEIPSGVTSIGIQAFDGCTSLSDLTLPSGLISIGNSAFRYTAITSLDIPETVTTIGQAAFYQCPYLAEVTIPASVTSIGTSAFSSCASLESITVDADNTSYASIDGVLFNADQTTLMIYPASKSDTSYEVPDTVTTISTEAFSDNQNIESVAMTSVTRIGSYAFYGDEALTTVEISDSITAIEQDAFNGCSSLSSLTIGSEDVSMDVRAFEGCTALAQDDYIIVLGYLFEYIGSDLEITLPDTVTTICGQSFAEAEQTQIIIPASVTNIGSYAFREMSSLSVLVFQGNAPEIEDAAFSRVGDITVYYPEDDDTWTSDIMQDYGASGEVTWVAYAEGEEPWNANPISDSATEITTDSPQEAVISEEGTYVYYKFVPEESGTYLIYSTGDYDTCAYLYDSETEVLASDDESGSDDNALITADLEAGETYYIGFCLYEGTGSFTVYVTLQGSEESLSSSNVTLSGTSFTYTGSAQTPTVYVTDNDGNTLTEDTDYTLSYSASERIDVGSYTITVTGTGDYTGTVEVTYKITAQKLSSSNVSLSYTSKTYNGSAFSPTVTVTNEAGATLTAGTDYTVTKPSGRKNAGTYTYKIVGTGNYTGTISKTLTIKQKSIASDSSAAKVTLSSTSYTYNGSAKKPTVTLKITLNGSTKKLTKNTDYTVSYKNNTNAGTATVTIKGTGNYKGTLTKTFTIKARSLSSYGSATLSTTTYTYNGSAKKPSVTVKATIGSSTKKLTKGTDYTVTYASGRKNCGRYKVTIKGTGNYSGTITKYFYIKPAKASTPTLSSTSSKKIKVSWTKSKGSVTGYQIYYRVKGTSTWKSVTTTSTSKTLSSLKSGKTYEIKIRAYKTISGKKYYGSWSKTKTKKCK